MKKKLKRLKKLKGVTLLELIIVMAIFSGISVGALAMVRPAMQLHYKTAAQERAVAAVDTMARFIQDNLRYADKMFVYVNHGIKDVKDADGNVTKKGIDIIQDYPFDYYPFGLGYICQTGTNSADDSGNPIFVHSGAEDPHHYVNPVSFFAQYYLEDSICFNATKSEPEKAAYFKDKVIHVMEIKNTGEVNVYSYPLNVEYGSVIMGVTYSGSRSCSSVSDVFSGGEEKINVDVKGVDKKGLSIDLSINYDGATIKNLTLNYNIAVNFMNLTSGSETIHVNDKFPYDAERYILFDWKNIDMYSKTEQGTNTVNNKGYPKIGNEDCYTYIVYSLPEIIP